jgi:hypothetical protein
MKRILALLFISALLILPSRAFSQAQEVKVTLSFDKNSVELDDKIQMVVRIEGGQGGIERPRIPQMPGFETYYLGRTSEVTIVNSVSRTLTEFTFSLVPQAAGKYKIPPVVVEVGSEVYRTPSSEIEVLGRQGQISTSSLPRSAPTTQPTATHPSSAPPPRYVQPPQVPTFGPSEQGSDIFAKAWLDRPTVYVGEQVTLNYSIYYRTDASLEGFEEEPVTTGFWTEEISMGRDLAKRKTTVAGLDYQTSDFRRLALFPTREGVFDIDPGSLRATVVERPRQSGNLMDDFFNDSFFQSGGFFTKKVPRVLKTSPVRITVLPLPEAGKPESFDGAVGDFVLQASVDKKSVRQNEPVTLTLLVHGAGNLETLNRPQIPEMPGVKLYDSDSNVQVMPRGTTIGGQKTFEVTLIPSQTGPLNIPAVEFSFFNPRTKSYQVQRGGPFQVEVTKGDGTIPPLPPEAVSAPKKNTKEAEDIYYIREKINPNLFLEKEEPIHWGLGLAAFLGTLVTLILFWRFRKEAFYAKNIGLKRRLFARRRAEKSLARLRKIPKDRLFSEAHRVMSEYLADKFNISAQGLTLTEIEAQLAHFNIDSDLYGKIRDFYDVTDRARFAPALISGAESEALISTLQETVKTLEKKIK